jgi:hypothetical protein
MDAAVLNLTVAYLKAQIVIRHLQSDVCVDEFTVSVGKEKTRHAIKFGKLAREADQLEFVLTLITDPAMQC